MVSRPRSQRGRLVERNPVRREQNSRVGPAQKRTAAQNRAGNRLLRGDRRHHLRGDGTARDGKGLQLVRRGLVLERRLTAAGPRLSTRCRDRRRAIAFQSTVISASLDQPVASTV